MTAANDATITIRVPTETRTRLAALATLLSAQIAGVEVPESAAIRAALLRGLDALEAELGGKGKR